MQQLDMVQQISSYIHRCNAKTYDTQFSTVCVLDDSIKIMYHILVASEDT